ncbi:hypothetical protein ACQ4PT_012937 [Festuca glaucescens]
MDREALLCLKSNLSDPRGALATWSKNASLDFCQWHGVSCSKRHAQRRVVALDLEGEGLAGQLPPCISNLTSLARIHLANNRLTGGVPPELGLLAGPRYLDLSHNALGGKIPANLSSCSGLEVHKQGVALGRSVDLSKFRDYDELKAELDKMFEFDGELVSSSKNWQIIYTNNEVDMMLVEDDQWE